jgi:hypothetical protein
MLKLEIDWAADALPDLDVVSNEGDDVLVVVVQAGMGAAGWTTIVVYAHALTGTPTYREAQELDAWLERFYGMDDEDERQDLLTLAVPV